MAAPAVAAAGSGRTLLQLAGTPPPPQAPTSGTDGMSLPMPASVAIICFGVGAIIFIIGIVYYKVNQVQPGLCCKLFLPWVHVDLAEGEDEEESFERRLRQHAQQRVAEAAKPPLLVLMPDKQVQFAVNEGESASKMARWPWQRRSVTAAASNATSEDEDEEQEQHLPPADPHVEHWYQLQWERALAAVPGREVRWFCVDVSTETTPEGCAVLPAGAGRSLQVDAAAAAPAAGAAREAPYSEALPGGVQPPGQPAAAVAVRPMAAQPRRQRDGRLGFFQWLLTGRGW